MSASLSNLPSFVQVEGVLTVLGYLERHRRTIKSIAASANGHNLLCVVMRVTSGSSPALHCTIYLSIGTHYNTTHYIASH